MHLLRFAEQLLASAIGSASSRLVLSLLLRRRNARPRRRCGCSTTPPRRCSTTATCCRSRSTMAPGHHRVRPGSAAHLLEPAFLDLFELPDEMGRVGVSLDQILRFIAERGDIGPGADRRARRPAHRKLRARHRAAWHAPAAGGRIIEIRSNPMPDGGIVTTYADITDTRGRRGALERANETLEQRVRERTGGADARQRGSWRSAKAEADEANSRKTRFLAAASHDILQPLNAARLYATRWSSATATRGDAGARREHRRLAGRGRGDPRRAARHLAARRRRDEAANWSSFRLDELLRQIAARFRADGAREGPRARLRAVAR